MTRTTSLTASLALAAGLLLGSGGAAAQSVPATELLKPSTALQPLPRGEAGRQLPIVLKADRVSGRPDLEALAEGRVEFRRGGLVIRADRLSYDLAEDLARASGQVRISRNGAVYRGPELQLHVQRSEGYFLQPEFEFPLLGAGGRARSLEHARASARVSELGDEMLVARRALERAWHALLAGENPETVRTTLAEAKIETLYPYRFLIGYSGWGAGQLEQELVDDSWLMVPFKVPSILMLRLICVLTAVGYALPETSSTSDPPRVVKAEPVSGRAPATLLRGWATLNSRRAASCTTL